MTGFVDPDDLAGAKARHPAGKDRDPALDWASQLILKQIATIAACRDLADHWEAEGEAWEGQERIDPAKAARVYARELRAALTLGWP